jgi:hypothetical protein
MLQTVQTPPPSTTISTGTAEERTRRIRELNDEFRTNGRPACEPLGRKMLTAGIRALGLPAVVDIATKVMTFNEFSEDNDPWGEHDFGAFDYAGHKIFWKIDTYAPDMEQASPDPTDPAVTCRVLTVMLASEY